MRFAVIFLTLLVVETSALPAKTCDVSTMREHAMKFFTGCETGKGWNGTAAFVTSDAAAFNAVAADRDQLLRWFERAELVDRRGRTFALLAGALGRTCAGAGAS